MKYLTPLSGGTVRVNVAQENSQPETDSNPIEDSQQETDLEFQRDLQLLFVETNQRKIAEINEALKADDTKTAHRLAHTLKSNAGQIGKADLQQAAKVVEQRLKHGNNPDPEQMVILETELNAVLSEFTTQAAP
jgi:HPt (histidine-containing phosphotransfer) domain-containing protein